LHEAFLPKQAFLKEGHGGVGWNLSRAVQSVEIKPSRTLKTLPRINIPKKFNRSIGIGLTELIGIDLTKKSELTLVGIIPFMKTLLR
jgi:hypothetical protein